MEKNEVGRFRFCPACGYPVMPAILESEDQNTDAFDPESPRCSCCKRPWIACPCTPADEGECQSERS